MSLLSSSIDFNILLNNNKFEKIIILLKKNLINKKDIKNIKEPFNKIIKFYYNKEFNELMDIIIEIIETYLDLYLFFLNEINNNENNKVFIFKLNNHLNLKISLKNKIIINSLPYFLFNYLESNKIEYAINILKEYSFILNNLILLKLNKRERFLLCYFSGLTYFLNNDYEKALKFLKISYFLFPVNFIKSKLKYITKLKGYLIKFNKLELNNNYKLNYFNKLWEKENDLIINNIDHEKILFFENYISLCFLDPKNYLISKILGIYVFSENTQMYLIKCYCLIEFLIKHFGKSFLKNGKMFLKSDILNKSYDILNLKRSVFDDFIKLIYIKKITGFYDFINGVFVIQSMDRGVFNF